MSLLAATLDELFHDSPLLFKLKGDVELSRTVFGDLQACLPALETVELAGVPFAAQEGFWSEAMQAKCRAGVRIEKRTRREEKERERIGARILC